MLPANEPGAAFSWPDPARKKFEASGNHEEVRRTVVVHQAIVARPGLAGDYGRMTVQAAGAGDDDRAVHRALAWYDIGAVQSVTRLPAGQAGVRAVTSTAGRYLLKPAPRRADVTLLADLHRLAADGIRQPGIIATAAGELVSPDGYFLQEYLPGEPELHPSAVQTRAVMRATGHLHAALGRLVVEYEPDEESLFVLVTDPGFLTAELPGLLRHYGLASQATSTAIAVLTERQDGLRALPRQLVHGDIGPDNVLLDGDQVVAIIDFTPHVLPVVLAASTALYWYHVYGQPAVSPAGLAASRAAIGEARPWTAAEDDLHAAGLVWESLRRAATTLEQARRAGTEPGPAIAARLAAVEAIATLQTDQD